MPTPPKSFKTRGTTAAEALAQHRGELMLDGLLYLPEDVAEAIAQHQGTLLTFESLRFLADGAANALAGYGGKLEIPIVEMGVKAASNASGNSVKGQA